MEEGAGLIAIVFRRGNEGFVDAGPGRIEGALIGEVALAPVSKDYSQIRV